MPGTQRERRHVCTRQRPVLKGDPGCLQETWLTAVVVAPSAATGGTCTCHTCVTQVLPIEEAGIAANAEHRRRAGCVPVTIVL
eukprot:358650-Chlamydomonas_euryale.AAC.1